MQRSSSVVFFFFQAEDGIRDLTVTGVQTCALPIWIGLVSATLYLSCTNRSFFVCLLQKSPGVPSQTPARSSCCRSRTAGRVRGGRSEEHTSELQSQSNLVCRLLLEKKKKLTVTSATLKLFSVTSSSVMM